MAARHPRDWWHDIILRGIKLLNAFLMTAVFGAIWYRFFALTIRDPFYRRGNYVVIFLFFLIYVTFGRLYDAFLVSYNRISEMIYSQVLAALIADVLMYIVCMLLKKGFPPVWPFLLLLLCEIAVSTVWSLCAHRFYFRFFKAKKTAIIWDMRKGLQQLISSYGLSKKFNVVATPSAKECVKDLSVLDNVETVFLTGVHSRDRNKIIKYCIERNIDAFIIPRVGDVLMSSARRIHMLHLPILRLSRYKPQPEYVFFKRFFDIVLSLLAIIILSPVMIITAIAIKRDGGPALYKQCRLTKDGKTFNVMKFRSMRVDAEKDGVARLSTGDHDDRITPVGKVIRKVRIDELPQLFNILLGDMSIVGPRPERPEIAAQYEEEMPEFRLRLQAKAGLTGYAQVYGKYNTTPYDKLQMDLMYIAQPSLVQDLRICFATVKILFMPESTEGIEEGTITASDKERSQ